MTATDLTARARIREAALGHFAEDGYERATIRAIARTAGVSPGLLRHHFGSKEDLRAACDGYVLEMVRQVNAEVYEDSATAAATRHKTARLGAYIARSLADGSPTSGPIFDEMAAATEQWLVRSDGLREDPPAVDRRVRAALLTAMALGVPLLREHVSRALGMDLFTPEGDRLAMLGLLDIYAHAVIDVETAGSAGAGFVPGHR
jgi:AcrR family transcriptional regulator